MDSYAFITSDEVLGFMQVSSTEATLTLAITAESFKTKTYSVDLVEKAKKHIWRTELKGTMHGAALYLLNTDLRAGRSNGIEIFEKLDLAAGTYYPRINNQTPYIYELLFSNKAIAIDEARVFLEICRSMEDIFSTVEAHSKNYEVFGNRIRHTLTISCIEVENLLVNTLKENGVEKERYTTNDYVRLLDPMELNKYQATLKMHPQLGAFMPFEKWNAKDPTKTLSWYNAYNASKHNRGKSAHEANLKEMVNAVAALHIILVSQYGDEIFNQRFFHQLNSPFKLEIKPNRVLRKLTPPIFWENGNIELSEKISIFNKQPIT